MTSAKKKRYGPVAWILAGCGGIVLITAVTLGGIMLFGFFKAKEVVEEFQEDPAAAMAE